MSFTCNTIPSRIPNASACPATMGCIFSLCESTPNVPENIIPDPVVRSFA
jgi:hypothetical protein